jgi:hypothetical protein
VQFVIPEVTFLKHASLIGIQPPFETVPLSGLEEAGLREDERTSALACFGPPKVKAIAAVHYVRPDQRSIVGPLFSYAVGKSVLVGLRGEHCSWYIATVYDPMRHSVSERAFVFKLACRVKNADPDNFTVNAILGLILLSAVHVGCNYALPSDDRDT